MTIRCFRFIFIVLFNFLLTCRCLRVQAFHKNYQKLDTLLHLKRGVEIDSYYRNRGEKQRRCLPLVHEGNGISVANVIIPRIGQMFDEFRRKLGRKKRIGVNLCNKSENATKMLKPQQSQCKSSFKRSIIRKQLQIIAFSSLLSLFMGLKKTIAAGVTNVDAANAKFTPLQGSFVWFSLFAISAILHSAESAITKISPYKVQEFADEEGAGSPFATLSSNLTRLLSTILLTTTACSIYSTALFVTTASQIFPTASLGFITAVLTVVTLFFGEILPKALAVTNSELVARKLVPAISRIAAFLSPFTTTINILSNFVLAIFGLRNKEDDNVSEDMLRMVIAEAQRTAGIDTNEGRMIKAVLDMDSREVQKIMRPRVDIVALPIDATGTQILQTALETKYSRLPVYDDNVDNIVGVLLTKDLLDFLEMPPPGQSIDNMESFKSFRPTMNETWTSLDANVLMEPTFFVPEKMSTWDALQAMRKRRVHMAIVVDEYGGTSGLVSFEDILEEVVGEIYDEDDDEEEDEDLRTIYGGDDGTINIKGSAELADVYDALGLKDCLEEEMEKYLEGYSTIGGLLTSLVGEIPQSGSVVTFSGYSFNITEVDDRRVILVNAERLSNTVHDNDDSNDGRDVKDGNGDNDGVNNDMRDSTINGNTKSVDAEQKQGSNSKTKAMDSSSQNSNANYESDVGKDIDRDIGDEDFKKKSFLDGEWVEVDDEKGAD